MIFSAHKRFDPSRGESWIDYINWSGLDHVLELVSTDSLLCPAVISDLIDADWKYNIHADFMTYFFHDFEYLKRRINYDAKRHNILGLTEKPSSPIIVPDEFEFCGYDILDSDNSISVLTNCGGFPEVFENSELNQFGLLNDLSRANEVASTIRDGNPDDHHCSDCRVWSLCRYLGEN